MHRATPSTSSSSSHLRKKRRLTREQLLKSLEILGPLGILPPPDLPPSPPASRESSPAPTSKRKLDSDVESSTSKKQRTASSVAVAAATDVSHAPQSTHARPSSSRPLRDVSSEEGEVPEDVPAERKPVIIASANVPIRRPRRGKPSYDHYETIHKKYMQYGKVLKYSGEKRMASMHPPSHRDYVALVNPPHTSSPYHKYGHLLARLEAVDGLVDFAYAMWSKEYPYKKCYTDRWQTIASFLGWCKHQWMMDGIDEREKAILGLIWLIEAAVHARTIHFDAAKLKAENDSLIGYLAQMEQQANEKARKQAEAEAAGLASGHYSSGSLATPPMLPSPASISSSSSANSTPNQPASANNAAPVRLPPAPPPHTSTTPWNLSNLPRPHFTVAVNSRHVFDRLRQCYVLDAAAYAVQESEKFLTLPIVAKHYPHTFARMMYSSLSVTDEHEPDLEDEEGELFWPGQMIAGEGLGWVCTMGKAMIKEFGRDYGYKGIDAAILKPKDGEEPPPPNAPPPPQPEPPAATVQR